MRSTIFLVVLLALLLGRVEAQSFNFSGFSGNEPVVLNGQAALVGSAMRLTQDVAFAKGSMFHQNQLSVASGFDTTLTINIPHFTTSGADGIAFVIHNDPRGSAFLGDFGSAMGYGHLPGNPVSNAISNALVFEFDTFQNSFNGFSDVSGNEISIHTNGTNVATQGEDQSLFRFPATLLSDGQDHTLRVLYTPGTLSIFFDGAVNPTVSIPYDFATGGTHILTGNTVGGLSLANGKAWVGFTSSTSLDFEAHEVVSWSFDSVPTLADDVELARISSPAGAATDCSSLTSSEVVKLSIRNSGVNAIAAGTLLTVSYKVDSNAPVFESIALTSPLVPGGILPYSFATQVDLSAVGNHTIAATVVYALDLNLSNNSLSKPVSSGGQLRITSYPFAEDFVTIGANGNTRPPLGFVNERTDAVGINADWIFRNDATLTVGTGPVADHTTGVAGMGGYAHVDDNSSHAAINLRSPCFDLNGLANPSLSFYLYSYDSTGILNPNLISLDVISYPSGAMTTDVFGPQGQTGPSWTLQNVDLSPFAGQVIQLIFRGETVSNAGNSHDVAIDDVAVFDLLPTLGQAPQPGLAVLDLNAPRNANGVPLSFAANGPYFSSVSAGDILNFKMKGGAMQPIILFAGPLNPGVASFAGIGSIDVGGPIDPLTGIPTFLTILADGTTLGGFNPFFVIAASGSTQVGFSVPNLPPGVLGTFQCAVYSSTTSGISLTNAVQVTVQ